MEKIKLQNSLIIFSCLLLIFTCQKEDINPKSRTLGEILNCIGSVNNPDANFVCEDDFPYDDDDDDDSYCIKDLGNFSLKDSSKVFVPQYCMDIGDKLVYKNTRGDELEMILNRKSYYRTKRYFSPNFDCEFLLTVLYCYRLDVVELEFRIENKDLELVFWLYPKPKSEDLAHDKLSILKRYGGSGLFSYDCHLSLSDRSTGNPFSFQEFHETIKIGDKMYENVFKYVKEVNAGGRSDFNYYYSSKLGLIAFFDKSDGSLWQLK